MKNRILLSALGIVAALLFLGWWLHDDPGGAQPLVCEQIAPGVRHAKACSLAELTRIRNAYAWIVENIAPPLSIATMAGVASFIEDTGRRKRSTFYRLINRGDIYGACEQMMAHIDHRGQPDPERIKRRGHERALCLSRGLGP